ncbi:CPBP family intramembrane glutamic endopeptidase [Pseudobutyrivibrio xylanivorans]|uniref:CPBP family intramembrane metalloprotease n=1 Tax=Pseudobutyrivibrio xylanivorans TaxID=185007 RepID=A0A5P6VPE7_PSEXY|nr:CPBP family intramembrane glutamic endopeptidase [Pseudobutyrivibrio xylanivorans]QFJ54553.1 CPBP family intramembrane metalloprotease [Pseudobutyrivibrio xylanivorans]
MNQNREDKSKFIVWIFLPTIFAILVQSAIAVMALQFYIVDKMANYTSGSYTDFMKEVFEGYAGSDSVAMISILYAVVTIVVGFLVFRNKFREGQLSTLAGKSKNLGFTIAGMVIFTLAMQYVTIYLVNSLSAAFPSWLLEYQELMDSAGIDSEMSLLMILYAIILGPVCEELLFRGITFFAAKKVMPVYFAILVQAIMFGAFHMNKLQGVYAFVLGLGLGYIMYLYDNLLMTIAVHVAYNFVGTICSEILPAGGNSILTFFLCSLASLAAAYASILLLRNGAASVKDGEFFSDI